ncbi:MAG: hypothetical protein ACRD6W_05260, partial [Nitrososphaerales archaeon]
MRHAIRVAVAALALVACSGALHLDPAGAASTVPSPSLVPHGTPVPWGLEPHAVSGAFFAGYQPYASTVPVADEIFGSMTVPNATGGLLVDWLGLE